MTEKATNNAAELQAAILGLEKAKANHFKTVVLNTDSKLMEKLMTKWIDQWKANDWKKRCGEPFKISIDLFKKLDKLRSEMDITWKWLPRNSCPEMVLADTLANHGCKTKVEYMPGEFEMNQLFRRTAYDRRMMYPEELAPTVLRSKEEVLIPPGQTISISCTLDISESLQQKLTKSKSEILNMTADQAFGFVTTLRSWKPMREDGTVVAQVNTSASQFEVDANGKKEMIEPTLVLPKGSVVGLAFSKLYGNNDGKVNSDLTGYLFWNNGNDDKPEERNLVTLDHCTLDFNKYVSNLQFCSHSFL